MDELEKLEHAKLNSETATIAWKEIEPYFEKGLVVLVNEHLDLVDVAFEISRDNTARVIEWIEQGNLLRDFNDQAARWLEEDAIVWCVVVRPWVLVQQSHVDAH